MVEVELLSLAHSMLISVLLCDLSRILILFSSSLERVLNRICRRQLLFFLLHLTPSTQDTVMPLRPLNGRI